MRILKGIYFESKVRRETTTEDGTQAKVVSLYVIDAFSFTECEARVSEFVASYTSGEFEVLTEARAAYNEIFFADDETADKWYKLRCVFVTLDEKSGKQKKSKSTYLVQASTIDGAKRNFDEAMQGVMVDYYIDGIHETVVEDIVEREVKDGE